MSATIEHRKTKLATEPTEISLPSGKNGVAKFYTLLGVAMKIGRSRDSLQRRYRAREFNEVAMLEHTDGEWPLFSEDQLPAIKELYL